MVSFCIMTGQKTTGVANHAFVVVLTVTLESVRHSTITNMVHVLAMPKEASPILMM
jgi:hypothetical protein